MILDPDRLVPADALPLDALLGAWAAEAPDRTALLDAPDRPLWTDGLPRRLTWAQLAAATGCLCEGLRGLGLGPDSVVAIQGPNSSDTVLAVLACLRAGLVPALLPAGWRNREVAPALASVGARAILTVTRAGPHRPAEALREVAAGNFSLRFVCSFGADVPDGVIALDGWLDGRPAPDMPRFDAAHLAMLTWDCGAAGAYPVGRSHAEWAAAGAVTADALGLDPDAVLLATLSPCSLAGLATGLVPWLLSGATLVLHQGFDAAVLAVQIEQHGVTHLVLPAPVVPPCLDERLLEGSTVRTVLSVARPAQAGRIRVPGHGPAVVGVTVLGEAALALAEAGDARLLPLVGAGCEAVLTPDGEVAVHGAMVPTGRLPGVAPEPAGLPHGTVATGYRAATQGRGLRLDGGRRDVIQMGGHTLAVAGLEELYAGIPGALATSVKAASDPVMGERLLLEAVPAPGSGLSASALAVHAERQDASPLSTTAEPRIGDRRAGSRLAGAA